VDDLVVQVLGALSLPGVQPVETLDDVTAVGTNQARLYGMHPVTEKTDWRIIFSTSTSGNESPYGASFIFSYDRLCIDSYTITNVGTATRTVSVGNSVAGTQYINAGSCPVGRTRMTLVTPYPSALTLWVNSNGTDKLVHTIKGHRTGNT
jgi:hypothetical protein